MRIEIREPAWGRLSEYCERHDLEPSDVVEAVLIRAFFSTSEEVATGISAKTYLIARHIHELRKKAENNDV